MLLKRLAISKIRYSIIGSSVQEEYVSFLKKHGISFQKRYLGIDRAAVFGRRSGTEASVVPDPAINRRATVICPFGDAYSLAPWATISQLSSEHYIRGHGRRASATRDTPRTPSLHHSITPPLHHSTTPSLHHSITPPLHPAPAPEIEIGDGDD
jgi:hypothetical protein